MAYVVTLSSSTNVPYELLYFTRWVDVATNGKASVSRDVADQSLFHIRCKECGSAVTFPIPDNPSSVRHDIQEFVRFHAHRGNFESKPVVQPAVLREPTAHDEKKGRKFR